MRKFSLLLLASLTIAANTPIAAVAADGEFEFAKSAGKKIRVLMDGGDKWCVKELQVKLEVAKGSPLIDRFLEQASFINRLGPLIAESCPEAESAQLVVVQPEGPQGLYQASKAGNWVFGLNPDSTGTSDDDLPVSTNMTAEGTPQPQSADVDSDVTKTEPVTDIAGVSADPTTQEEPTTEVAAPEIPAASPVATEEAPSTPSTPAAPPESTVAELADNSDLTDPEKLFLAYLRHHSDDETMRQASKWWAEIRYPKEFSKTRKDEFKLDELLTKTRADITNRLASLPEKIQITALLNPELGEYNNEKGVFPLSKDMRISYQRQPDACYAGLPGSVKIEPTNLVALHAIHLDRASAKTFLGELPQYGGSPDRTLVIEGTFEITGDNDFAQSYEDRTGGKLTDDVASKAWGKCVSLNAKAVLLSARVLAARNSNKVLYQFTPEDIKHGTAEAAAAEAEKIALEKAEQEKEAQAKLLENIDRLRGKRDQLVQDYPKKTPRARLETWYRLQSSTGPEAIEAVFQPHDDWLTTVSRLNARAKLLGQVQSGLVLLRLDGNEREAEITWPTKGHAKASGDVKLPNGWVLAHVATSEEKAVAENNLTLIVHKAFACTNEVCGEANDVDAFRAKLDAAFDAALPKHAN